MIFWYLFFYPRFPWLLLPSMWELFCCRKDEWKRSWILDWIFRFPWRWWNMFFCRSNVVAWKNPWKGWNWGWGWRRLLYYILLPSVCYMPTFQSRWSWRISTNSFFQFTSQLSQISISTIFITDKYCLVMNAKNHVFISFIIKSLLIFSYSY